MPQISNHISVNEIRLHLERPTPRSSLITLGGQNWFEHIERGVRVFTYLRVVKPPNRTPDNYFGVGHWFPRLKLSKFCQYSHGMVGFGM